jgi:hypothetical protein
MTSKDTLEHSIIFNQEIYPDTVQELMDRMTQYPIVNLYFSTDGGELDTMLVLIDFLNRRAEQGNVRVYLSSYCSSAGTLLLTDYNGPLYVQPTFRFFYFHVPDFMSYKFRKVVNEDRLRDLLLAYNETYYDKLKVVGLTRKQIDTIRKGDELYIFADELGKLKTTFITDEFEDRALLYKPYDPPIIKKIKYAE